MPGKRIEASVSFRSESADNVTLRVFVLGKICGGRRDYRGVGAAHCNGASGLNIVGPGFVPEVLWHNRPFLGRTEYGCAYGRE